MSGFTEGVDASPLRERVALLDQFVERSRRFIDGPLQGAFAQIEQVLALLHELASVDPDGLREAQWSKAFVMMDDAMDEMLRVQNIKERAGRLAAPVSRPPAR